MRSGRAATSFSGKSCTVLNDSGAVGSYNRDMRRYLLLPLFWCLASTGLHADGPAFDLSGPKVDVHVKRGEVTLPIGETPNLLPGDRLWVHPDFPESQATHYVLVVAFLRGVHQSAASGVVYPRRDLDPRSAQEGVFVTVPAEAQQALMFLAPETGGDFSTLRKAVINRPGAFVRATQDLQAASWDRMRLECLPGRSQGHLANRSQIAEGASGAGVPQPGHQVGPAMFRQAQRPAGSLPGATHRRHGAGRCQRAIAGGAVDQRFHRGPDEPDQFLKHGRRRSL